MRKNLFWLSNEQWARIEPYLPKDVRGVERVDDVVGGPYSGGQSHQRHPLLDL
jgi:hypothetical protein